MPQARRLQRLQSCLVAGRQDDRFSVNGLSRNPAWQWITQTIIVEHPDCSSGWSRLSAGGQAIVSKESLTPNRVRSAPSTIEPILVLLYPGSVLRLIEGPICADGLVFWKVENELIPGGVGWTAEGDGKEYFLELFKP